MGARQRIEDRMIKKAAKKANLKVHLIAIKQCSDKAEEEKLPTAAALKSIYHILEELVSGY